MTSLFVVNHLIAGVKLLMSAVQVAGIIPAFYLAVAISRRQDDE